MNLTEMERRATILRPDNPRDAINQLKAIEEREWKPRMAGILRSGDPYAADALFYRDLREPFIGADQGDITLAATAKAMYTPSAHPVLGGQYWARVGKKIKIRMFGKITTAATPGNLTIDVYYGSGADANGTILVSSAAQTLIANQTTLSWELEMWVHCRSTGSAGTLFADGRAFFNTAVIAAGYFAIPASTAVVSGAVDLTAANVISVQFRRSGSTAEHAWTQDFEFEALN